MTVRDELLRAAVFAGARPSVVVGVHRVAPLVEYAVLLQQALTSADVFEAAIAERTNWLEEQLLLARRENVLLAAQLAALAPPEAPAGLRMVA